MTIYEVPSRDHRARQACRVLGDLMNCYVTGDPGSDSLAEYLAAGWLLTDDYYAEEGERTPTQTMLALAAALNDQARALDRLAEELRHGTMHLADLRRIEMPR